MKIHGLTTLGVSVLLNIAASVLPAHAAPGDVDVSFDAKVDIHPGSDTGSAVSGIAVQPDGKVIICGDFFRSIKGTSRNRIARLEANGNLEINFNPLITPTNGAVKSIVLQSDGKILVGGRFDRMNGASRTNIARLNADGSLDTSFDPGTGSAKLFRGGNIAYVKCMALQADGKVLIGGDFETVDGTSRTNLARLNANGSLDHAFSQRAGAMGGSNNAAAVESLAVQTDGKILMGGSFFIRRGAELTHWGIVRLNSDGSLDNTFDSFAIDDAVNDTFLSSDVFSILVQSDGRILVGGYLNYYTDQTPRFAPLNAQLVRLNTDGSFDPGFNPAKAEGSGRERRIFSLAEQTNGRILVGGEFATINGVSRQGLARLNLDGSLNSGFQPSPGFPYIYTIALQSNGRILIGGALGRSFPNAFPNDFSYRYVARLLGDSVSGLPAMSPTANAANGVTASGFTANWTIVTGATGYRLDVSTSSSFSSFVSGYQNLDVSNASSRSVTGLSANTTYYYRVRAYNAAGLSPNSGTISVTTSAVATAPSAPTATSATGVNSTGFTANWSGVTGATAGYRLDVSTTSTFSIFVSGYQDLPVLGSLERNVNGLSPGTTYFYRVRAANGTGVSANSATIVVTTSIGIPSPAAATSVINSGFTANWIAVSGATGYRLDVSASSSFSSYVAGYQNLDVGNVLSQNVTALTASTTYYYRVRAYNSFGSSGNSGTVTVITTGQIVAWGRNGFGQTTAPFGLSGVVAIAAGGLHTVALKNDGTVVAWGGNDGGQAAVPTGLSGVTAIAAGGGHTLALKSNGTIVAWGAGGEYSYGQTKVPVNLGRITAIAAGAYHTLALKADGTVVAWGADGVWSQPGQTKTPTSLSGVTAIAAGAWHNVALKSDGTVVAWGDNSTGQTNVPGGLGQVRAIAAGDLHTVVLRNDGTIAGWGSNRFGESTAPPGLSGVIAIEAAGYHTVALKNDGTVVAWGWNDWGQTNVPTGLRGVTAIAAAQHIVALVGTAESAAPSSPAAHPASSTNSSGFIANWTGVAVATGYRLDVSTSSAFSSYISGYQNLDVGNVLSREVAGLSAGTTYYYRVRAYNSAGPSVNSGTITVTTSAGVTVPSAPTLKPAIGVTSSGFMASWNSVSGATGYRLDVSTSSSFSSYVSGHQNLDLGNTLIQTVSGLSASTTYYYRVRAYNSGGTSPNSTTINLTTTPATAIPIITSQPQNQTVIAGTSVAFSVTATGTAPLSYQWRRNGANIPGAISATLTIASAQITDTAGYTVVVSNASGSVTSAPATLTVNPPSAPGYVFTTLAGAAGISGSADGFGTAKFNNPVGLAVDAAGNVYVGDRKNHTIRKIMPNGTVTTLAGSAGNLGSADGSGSAGRFNQPLGLAADPGGNVFVADSGNSTIRRITPNGVVSTFAGFAGSPGGVNGTGSAARFRAPYGVALDSSGNLYVADGDNHSIRKITPGGIVSTLAGSLGTAGSANGTGSTARFSHPEGLAVDGAGNVFVADTWNHTIRKVTPGGVVTTLAGSSGSSGSANGTGASARFYYPTGLAVDGTGTIFVADQFNHTLRKITRDGVVTTLAGASGQNGNMNGTGSVARFNQPIGVFIDATGNLYVTDYSNHTIRRGTLAAPVNAGAGTEGGDFNGDGLTDLLFQDANGFLATWMMSGADRSSGGFLQPNNVGDASYRIAATADFNRDGKEDVLFQHADGTLAVWFMNGTSQVSASFLDPRNPGDKNWRVVCAGDFNSDGKADLVFQHTDGTLAAWFLDGTKRLSAALFNPPNPGDAQWRVAGAADFSADGNLDLVFQHTDGTLAVWYFNGITRIQTGMMNPQNPGDKQWRVVSIADRNKDGKPDLLFQHADGSLAVWFMDGLKLSTARLLTPSKPGGSWKVVAP